MTISKKIENSDFFQLVWGSALLLMGGALFLRIPEIVADLAENNHIFGGWYVSIPLYLISLILVGGGGRKLFNVLYPRPAEPDASPDPNNASTDADHGSDAGQEPRQ